MSPLWANMSVHRRAVEKDQNSLQKVQGALLHVEVVFRGPREDGLKQENWQGSEGLWGREV